MAKSFTFTKADLSKIRASEAKMSAAKKRQISKALVEANSAANSRKKGKA